LGYFTETYKASSLILIVPQVLEILPVPKNLLEASGVKATVAQRLPGHGKLSTRTLAQKLLARWEPKPAQAALPKSEPASEGLSSSA